jgi:capsular polysaccharide export protein
MTLPMRVPPADAGECPARILATRDLLRRWPHLPAFWPAACVGPLRGGIDADAVLALPVGDAAPARWDGRVLRLSPGPFAPPGFAGRRVPAVLLAAEAPDPVARVLATTPAPDAAIRPDVLRDTLRAARIGGPPNLPDPGPAVIGHGPAEAMLVIDPCDPSRRAAARVLWRDALARAAGRPVLALRDPHAPAAAAPLLGATRRDILSPWTLLDAAAELHALPGPMALLGSLAGVVVRGPGGVVADGVAAWVSIAAAARCADPVRGIPIGLDQAIALLGEWRAAEAANRRIAVCLGMSFWKRRRMAAVLATAAGPPAFARTARDAVALASARGGAVAVWPSRAPADLPARAAAAGVPVVWVEDGFIRSAGLGAGFLPAASLTIDARRPYFDPGGASDLEILLATSAFPPALLARAATLRGTLVARGITKYNLAGTAAVLPPTPGRRRILVPGQVEDDQSILRGAAGAVRGNLDLLRAVRQAAPDAFIAFKPHPDVEAGYRRGAVPADAARALADIVLDRAPIAPLLDQVHEVHTVTSLTGFEALLRGRAVTCWGQPFYAGWGLTDDRAPIVRRVRRLTLDELVAGALILYPRYQDPVSELPCPPEALLDRLAQPAAWQGGLLARLRRWQGRAMARLLAGRG